MKVSALKTNKGNPRQIRGEKLDKLKASIAGFQKMMELRPMIVDETNTVLGGNMRLAAIKAMGMKDIPDTWVRRAEDLTEDEKAEFIVKDNVGFGEWDWDLVANEWDHLPLSDWGLDVSNFEAIDPEAEWQGMPEFSHEDKTAFQSIVVHCKTQQDIDDFAKLVNQKITNKTRFLWYPQIEIDRYADKRYAE